MLALLLALAAAPPLTTTFETSGGKRTGRYDEVVRLCGAYEKSFPGRVKCVSFGTTPERRPMLALVASDDGVLDPAAAREKRRPVVLFQGGIHAGEIDGKDAGFQVLRETLEARRLLGAVTVVFVPVFNADGHERFGAYNRPNQRGPEMMGWRTTAQNLNLNRDYAKADAPEMAAMLALLGAWDPIVYADLHVTDGADFQHDVAIMVDPAEAGPEELRELARAVRGKVVERVQAAGHLPLPFYPSFVKDDDPSSGFAVGVGPPRFSNPYWSLHNRLGVLVETHSWKEYARRVKATHAVLVALLELAAAEGTAWRAVADRTDAWASSIGGSEVALAWKNTAHVRTIELKGFAYTRELSAISGGMRISYDPKKPEIWKVPLLDELEPAVKVTAPRAGYVVPAAHASWVADKLKLHGVRFSEVTAERAGVEVEAFRAKKVTPKKTSYEGRQQLDLEGAWAKEKVSVPAGSLFVPIAQPLSRLVLHLFEPTAPDAFVRWGFMNVCFEQREYMEPYVAEAVAASMLARDPALRAEFEKLVASDADFAKSPEARLDFFYRRHPSWDTRMNLYPVLRADAW